MKSRATFFIEGEVKQFTRERIPAALSRENQRREMKSQFTSLSSQYRVTNRDGGARYAVDFFVRWDGKRNGLGKRLNHAP